MKPAWLRPQAEMDLVQMAGYYAKEAGAVLGERAFSAAVAALEAAGKRPAAGSARLGQLCEIPGLRSRRVQGFPMQWFYFERENHIDVVRLLGDRQDIVAILGSDAPS